ncbi:MAG: hypothetical protein ACI9U2_001029 [Bradymonadia bacterium]|jgi:hypothetical protein
MTASSLFKHLALAAALSVGGYVGSEALSPLTGVSLVGQAQAQTKFTGKIKNIRIKKRRTGSGFKIVGLTAGDDSNAVASATVDLSAAGTGEPLGSFDLGAAKRGRIESTLDLSAEELTLVAGQIINIEVVAGRLNDDGQPGDDVIASIIPVELVEGVNGRPRGDGVGEDGWKARVRVNRAGALVAVILNENKGWDGALDAVSLIDAGGEPRALALGDVSQRRVATTRIDLEAAGPLAVETTLFDAEGAVIDTRSEVVNVSEDAPAELSKVTVRQTNGGDAKLVTITQNGGQSASLAVNITDAETGEVVLETVDDTPVSTVRTFAHSGLEFDPGESAGGFIYLCLIDLLDANGDPFGQQTEIEMQVPEYVEGEVNLTVAPFSDGEGQVIMTVDDAGYTLSVGLRGGSNVVAANIIFEEPYEGPAPLETEVTTEFSGQLNKWVQKGDGGLPANYTVGASLTEGGVVVSGVDGARGEGTGTVYKASGNGSGTKKAAAQAQQSHLALL